MACAYDGGVIMGADSRTNQVNQIAIFTHTHLNLGIACCKQSYG